MAYKPSVYTLGGRPEIVIETTGIDGTKIIPVESRLSIKRPDGVIVTYSGDDLTVASGYLSFLYSPPTIGWYEYEAWVKDATGREDADSRGFEVVDRVY